jgi:hypothetical protein
MSNIERIEKLRKSFKPQRIGILLVGESPPEQGKFFYEGGVLHNATRDAFKNAFDLRFDEREFLDCFRDSGCYLDDISEDPVNKKDDLDRNYKLIRCIPELEKRLREYSPEIIVVIMKKIGFFVKYAAMQSKLEKTKIYYLPFPAYNKKIRKSMFENFQIF